MSFDRRKSRAAVPGRRRVLAGTVGILGIAAQRAMADVPSSAAPIWMREQGAPIVSPPYGIPSAFEQHVIRRPRGPVRFPTAASSGTPLQDLHGIITPNGLHYEHPHAGVPQIDPDVHRLLIHGLVDRPLSLNGIVANDAVLDANSLPRIAMPNRDGFISPDPRSDVR
jgi:sulfane dehydrogenase subunit SoxC